MTAVPAARLHLTDRGTLATGLAGDVVVFDVSGGDPVAFISALRNRPGFQTTRFFASGPAFTDDGISLVRRGYEAAFRKPYSVRTLLEAISTNRAYGARKAG
jgi:predicted amidohydrolase